MKKFISLILAVIALVGASTVNTFAIQDDVKKAYMNELQWICSAGHTMWYSGGGSSILSKQCSNPTDVEYCVYDINKDGYKELCVKVGCCEADYTFKFYGCEYGKIVSLGTFSGGHSGLYECDADGIFVYGGHMGCEWLYRLTKNGHSLSSYKLFERDLNPLFAAGNSNPWHTPKKPITMYDGTDYSGLY